MFICQVLQLMNTPFHMIGMILCPKSQLDGQSYCFASYAPMRTEPRIIMIYAYWYSETGYTYVRASRL